MELGLAGKRALVTGASKGIGKAVALALAEEGCDLVLVARSEALLAAVADLARERRQVGVAVIAADLSQPGAAERVAAEAGTLDLLVNNAGAIPPGGLAHVDETAWRAGWDLKVFGYINLSRALYPRLKDRAGIIVNVIGAAGERFDPGYVAGSAGNAALMAFTKALGKQAPRDGMRVVGINPGLVATDRVEVMLRGRARREFGDEARWPEFLKHLPFGRPATPQEIADAVAFLASPRSGYTSGTILTIDGGGGGGGG
jgi:hypothetical protein